MRSDARMRLLRVAKSCRSKPAAGLNNKHPRAGKFSLLPATRNRVASYLAFPLSLTRSIEGRKDCKGLIGCNPFICNPDLAESHSAPSPGALAICLLPLRHCTLAF